ncbi:MULTISPECIES: oligopeptide/dipeptide ABC transporter ATP-binding protein [unclassified Streptomyces]|uniref:ABC transporter ATP-binding protein n=1 Tax=unclassified Streptomyces TaxID=2593676 RepID=UPI0024734C81|nr:MULTISPECIES: oligopeptide/dipeptide ABC transporter ATP-binding protein [unclassified Streptomyces]MDH6447804.1 oligopeptide/dipeptide ABC transporter ATP-binding protein [Streptomyces sp. SAI-119]MDH6501473.1 oligopeptide/dipeptide ABC transporter ATP-binding protein [Streptomyces sp. SAI-149]
MTAQEIATVDEALPPGGEVLLRATDVTKHYPARGRRQVLRAVDGVSLEVRGGETLGVVGESGCGKSTLGRCLVRLTELTGGRVEFDGRDISTLSRRRLRPVRPGMQLVFQDPHASLNPRRRAGDIVAEPLLVHRYGDAAAVRRRVAELFDVVGLAAAHLDRYPHEFSGGQRQRIGIARALATQPKLIVADEPVSALDVSIQAQVLNLFADLQDEFGLTYVFIAHDLGVVRHVSDRIAVMYLGEIVELAGTEELFAHPAHPYTQALLSAVPDIDDGQLTDDGPPRERIVLTGEVPSAADRPTGCPFRTRCPYVQELCAVERPRLTATASGHQVACHYPLGD